MSELDSRDDWPASALQTADTTFIALTTGPDPLALDVAALAAAAVPGTAGAGGAVGGTAGEAAGTADPGGGSTGRSAEAAGTDDAAEHPGASGTGRCGTSAGPAETAGAATVGAAGGGGDCAAAPVGAGADLDLPVGEVPLPALRDWLMAHPNAYPIRDAVWRELIRRARQGKPEWVVAAVGMAMPALVAMAGTFAAGYHGDPADLDSEILTGFLEGLRHGVDPNQDAPHASLCFAAWRAGRDLRLAQQDYLLVADVEHAAAESQLPPPLYGHVDLLILRAEALGIVDTDDVEPFILTRLCGKTPELIAEKLGVDHEVLRMRLARADTRIVGALADGVLTGTPSPAARKELTKRHKLSTSSRAGKAGAAARRAAASPVMIPTTAAA